MIVFLLLKTPAKSRAILESILMFDRKFNNAVNEWLSTSNALNSSSGNVTSGLMKSRFSHSEMNSTFLDSRNSGS